jgi:DNA primase
MKNPIQEEQVSQKPETCIPDSRRSGFQRLGRTIDRDVIAALRDRLDIVAYVQSYVSLKHQGRNYVALCPFHDEKTPSFKVNSERKRWHCFGGCNTGGDIISFAMRYHGWTFPEACAALAPLAGLDLKANNHARPTARPPKVRPMIDTLSEPPSPDWQSRAEQIVCRAQETLWSDVGLRALGYLRGRGLSDDILRLSRLGYIRAQTDDDRSFGYVPFPDWLLEGKPVRIFPGITIPHYADRALWAIRIRTDSGQPKYLSIRGGRTTLYWSDSIVPGDPILLTEGEFDCLITHQTAQSLGISLSTVSLASASNSRINRRWWSRLITSPQLLVRVDDDKAGRGALEELRRLTAAVRAVQVPAEKDINDYYLKAGTDGVAEWLRQLLAD